MWTGIAALRLLLIGSVVLVGVVLSLFVPFFSAGVYHRIAANWYGIVLALTGIRARYQGAVVDGPVLIVSNHVSWADVLVIGARWPFIFLAMQEINRWPVVGWLSRRVGTLFILRGRGAPGAIRQVSEALRSGQSVILFPEGRTSPGIEVKRFHPRIFQAAINAGVPVQPVGLVYQDHGTAPGGGTRATYSDDAGFLSSLWRTMAGPRVDVEVVVFPALSPTEDREALARAAWEHIRGHPGFQCSFPH